MREGGRERGREKERRWNRRGEGREEETERNEAMGDRSTGTEDSDCISWQN